jgi:serine/threonine-protein kinase
MTGSGSMIGTPYYMSPEQCSGKKVTGSADQYSLGVMAYELLSGQLPFTGDSTFDIIRQHCMDPPPPLREVSPKVPSAMVAVVERALSKSPDDRYPSVLDFAVVVREAWGASGEAQTIPSAHRTVTARSARGGLSPTTPRTSRSSVTVDVGSLPPVSTEALTPEEPRKPAPELESQGLAPPESEPELAAATPPAPEREEPRRPAPRPMAPPQSRPAPFALMLEQQQERKALTPVAIVAVLALAAGSFGAWKLISVRAAPSAAVDSVTASAGRVTSDSAKSPVTPSPRAARAPSSAQSRVTPLAPRAPVVVGGTVSFVVLNLPPGAELWFDGLPVPGTSWRARAGVPHELVLYAPGYDPWSGTYTLRANETQRIDFRRVLRRAN